MENYNSHLIELMEGLNFNAEDLQSNRDGKLAETQSWRLERRIFTLKLLFLLEVLSAAVLLGYLAYLLAGIRSDPMAYDDGARCVIPSMFLFMIVILLIIILKSPEPIFFLQKTQTMEKLS